MHEQCRFWVLSAILCLLGRTPPVHAQIYGTDVRCTLIRLKAMLP